jgi:2,3-bisphosphoglycerate-independent phosphoglycerate mutase
MRDNPPNPVLWIFLDGVGIGRSDPSCNPFARFEPTVLRVFQEHSPQLPREGLLLPADPCLGVPGIPQSATGQTTLFTGVNAARYVGFHQQGFPSAALKDLIARRSAFLQLRRLGMKPTFANVYTPRFFTRRPRWVSVTTVMAETSGVRLRTLDDLHRDRGLFMDFTNEHLFEQDLAVPRRSPEEAAGILTRLALDYHLCLYEFFLTDLAGHRGTMEAAEEIARRVDRFLAAVVNETDLTRCSVLVTSDHGNLEDKSRKQHTLNLVPIMVWGPLQGEFRKFRSAVFSLDQICPAVVNYLENGPAPGNVDVLLNPS